MESSLVVGRLKEMLVNDKKESPLKLENVIKSEIIYVLKNYMDINCDKVEFNITIDKEGKYEIQLYTKVDRLKMLNYIV